jgi:glycosyl hydrolase family 6/Big-like domain-containing protein
MDVFVVRRYVLKLWLSLGAVICAAAIQCAPAAALVPAAATGAIAKASLSPDIAPSDFTWSGASTTTQDWSDVNNWGGTAPSGAVTSLAFPNVEPCASNTSCETSMDDVAGLSTGSVSIESNGTYDITGDPAKPLSLDSSSGLTVAPSAGSAVVGDSVTFTVPVTLTADQQWSLNPALPNEPITFGSITGAGENLTMEMGEGGEAADVQLGSDTDVGQLTIEGYGNTSIPPGGQLNSTTPSQVVVGDGSTRPNLVLPSGTATAGPLELDQSSLSIGSVAGSGSAATLSVDGAYTTGAASNLNLSIVSTGTTAGADYSQLNVSGNATLSQTTLALTMPATTATCPAPGETVTLLTAAGITGTFASLANGASTTFECDGRSLQATVSYTATTVTATVAQDPTSTHASCTPANPVSGTQTTCTATVSDTATGAPTPPTGMVTFSLSSGAGSFGSGGSTGSCTLAAPSGSSSTCSTTFTPSTASATTDTLALAYAGDSEHALSTGTANVQVKPPDTTAVSVSCQPQEMTTAATSTCTVTVLDSLSALVPTGSITLASSPAAQLTGGGTCTLAQASTDSASCQISVTPSGSGQYQLTATYAGDASHDGAHGQVTIGVGNPTSTALNCVPSTVPSGTAFECTVSVTDVADSGASLPTGAVIFTTPRGWATVSGCSLSPSGTANIAWCQLELTPNGAGTSTLTVAYSGDSSHLVSTGQQTVTITPAQPPSGPPGTQCVDQYTSASNRADRLMLPVAPGSDPLRGANLFVSGPTHGFAAGAIAQLLGIDPNTPVDSALPGVPETESWAAFAATIPLLEAKLGNPPTIDHEVALLEKIASEPETQRISSFSQGGGPGAIYSQTQKLFCHNFLADPEAVPVISTYFLHPNLGGCATPRQIRAYEPTFHRRVNELAEGTGNRPAVFLVEIDGLGSSSCMARQGDLSLWLAQIKYEAMKLISLPHTLVYVEGGYSDSNSPSYTAKALKAIGIKKLSGFWTNDTHINWTINEIRWGEKVSRLTGGAHFVINTAQNGNGPLINKHRTTQGNEDLCNPPNRALGPEPRANTGYPNVDAFIWASTPGISSGTCSGGTASGTFWVARALQLAAVANNRLGPSFPSQPY